MFLADLILWATGDISMMTNIGYSPQMGEEK
jgi:hypothetical protein